ncbi:MAG: NAD(P)/FAD-dependent oxidoreductase [Daejeonella sp.]|uniref:NAD(P)/FAD-dependent oxidoreductase n=1 Tax=Daejeonella sp. TaxID=2805397 RepID=UPI003C741585
MEQVVIIGNGIAGVTAARHIRMLSDKRITIISAESEYFFSRTALMYIYMGHMKFEHTQPYDTHFWKDNKIDLVKGYVEHVDVYKKTLHLDGGETISYDKLIIASGSKSNMFNWPGQSLDGVTGLCTKQDLGNLEKFTPGCKTAVVVGGGLIGIELTEMLLSRKINVTFLVREKSFWNTVLPDGESQLLNTHILEHGVDLRLETELKEINADENGRVNSVLTSRGEIIPCQIVGLAAGVSPNIEFLRKSGIELGIGVRVNRFLETNIDHIYAVGDCAEQLEPLPNRKSIEAVWYTGRMMGETLAQTICGNRMEYNPGNWFNSAKFLDIEYQTYGWIWNKPRDNESHFYWEHSSGKKCIRICYDKNTSTFLGINTFGIRMRHEFFDHALAENRSVDYIIDNLSSANFDPEFYSKHEPEIQSLFYQTISNTL